MRQYIARPMICAAAAISTAPYGRWRTWAASVSACSRAAGLFRPPDLRARRLIARLSQLDLDFGNFATARCRLGQEECALSQRVSAETGCGADQAPCETASGFGRLASCFYAQASPQGRQGAPLLERRREPPGIRRQDGAAACALSGRDQRQPARCVVSDDRGVRRGRADRQTDRAVSRGSCAAGVGLRCRARPAQWFAATPSSAMGWLLAGLPPVGSASTG